MRPEAYAECMRDLNRLVFAAEDIDTPAMPDALRDLERTWRNSPTSFEAAEPYGDEERTIEAAEALGLKWQLLAVKFYEAVCELDLDDFENELAGLRAKAKQARLSMIALEEYDPTAGVVTA